MAAQKGSLVLLKVGDGADPEVFTTIGGLRANSFTHNNQPVDATNKESGAWRQLLCGAGIRSISLSGSGAFQIGSYQRAGNYNGEETYALSLVSAGAITFTPAA